jgi:hypothetical protein
MRNAAIYQFEVTLPQFIVDAGMITDEFQKPSVGLNAFQQSTQNGGIDQRILPEAVPGIAVSTSYGESYNDLQSVRKLISQAIGALAAYDTVASDTASARIMRGELYAIEGYTEIMLADLFCSGVPLSTLDFGRNYTYYAGSKTADIYRSAIAKFDTAIVLANDVDSVVNLARVGRGRAWLNIGQYDSAVIAVQAVPNDYRYAVIEQGSAWIAEANGASHLLTFIVSDHEGTNGLPYVSSADPRSAVALISTAGSGGPRRIPAKYQAAVSGASLPIVIADGIEAQLIRAEAALQGGDIATWLTTLNALRTSGQVDSVTWVDTVGVSPAIYGDSGRFISQQVDTAYNATHTSVTHIYTIDTYRRPVWRAGTGGVSGLYPISDPGTASARIDTLFVERAEWLFATGHRQGDLRRLLRQYGNLPAFSDQSLVYPAGVYTVSGTGVYGSDVNVPIPAQEYVNPLFHGCLNRGA